MIDKELQEYDDIHYKIVDFIENTKNPAENISEFFDTFSHRINRGITRTFLMAIKPVRNKYNLENIYFNQ